MSLMEEKRQLNKAFEKPELEEVDEPKYLEYSGWLTYYDHETASYLFKSHFPKWNKIQYTDFTIFTN